jgi:hypothetical protein
VPSAVRTAAPATPCRRAARWPTGEVALAAHHPVVLADLGHQLAAGALGDQATVSTMPTRWHSRSASSM